MSDETAIRVLLVDDHQVVRMGVAAVLKTFERIVIVGEAEDGKRALEQFRDLLPDVVLMDLRLPGGGGIEALKAIRAEFSDAKVVMFTTYDFEEDIHRALQAGAVGYLLKNSTPGELSSAIISAHEIGKVELTPEVSARLADREGVAELTAREHEVLALLVKGLTNKDIARVLGFTPRTAKAHVTNLLVKLGVTDRTEAAAAALQRGIVPMG